jgi:predicted RNA-binding Zn-ribbon protein involved in translation (DUF1610 family)
MGGDASSGTAQPLVIIVPRAKPDLGRSLSHSFGDDGTVQVILDRRFLDRRVGAGGDRSERRRGERRLRSDMDSELEAGRWVAVPRASGQIDFLDPDVRAVLFLCCGQHIVPCQSCQNIYRLGWIPRVDGGVFPCPRCGNDLTPTVVAHVHTCRYWPPGAGTARPPSTVGPHNALAEAAAD